MLLIIPMKLKRPHKVIDGRVVPNARKNGDKYTRQSWNKDAPMYSYKEMFYLQVKILSILKKIGSFQFVNL